MRDAGFTSWVRRSTLPGAVLVVLTAAAIWQLSAVREPVREESAVFVEDYLRRAVGQDHIETTDPEEVTRFLERELGLRFLPIQLAGLELSRAEICLLEGRRGAMIVYKKNGAEVAHYLVPRDDSPRRDPALSTKGRPDSDAMPVVTWATPNLEQALVGQLDAEDLLRIAWRGRS